jgi:hypothetical protein
MIEMREFTELEQLYHAGSLTEAEHAEARRKLEARSIPSAGLTAHAVEVRPRTRPAHRRPVRPTARRWPWVALAMLVVAAGVVAGVIAMQGRSRAPSPGPVQHASATSGTGAAAAQSRASQPAPVVVGSPVNSALTIDVHGANAQITVSHLVAAEKNPLTAPATTVYSAAVTIVGVSGSFAVDPSYFSARSASGASIPVTLGAVDTPLTLATVAPGHQVTGTIAFVVPRSQQIAAILFTTPLGEQLGLWSTS